MNKEIFVFLGMALEDMEVCGEKMKCYKNITNVTKK